MERARSAREAVTIIGQLAEEHGFYGEGSFEGSAESLLIADKHEGWIFHVLAHPNGVSAIWAAQRLPDTHVTVVANMFIIREMNLSNTEEFLGTVDMAEIARKFNLSSSCPSAQNCDFTGTFSDGEYG
jgi:dipeptidase